MQIGIGDLIISFSSSRGQIPEVYHDFLLNKGPPTLVLELHYGKIPEFPLEEKIFNTKYLWSCYKSRNRYIFKDRPLNVGSPNLLISIEPDFNAGDIYTNSQDSVPFQYPLDEIITINLLSRNYGILAHACGISDSGQGILFVGSSGTGKSTLANLFKSEEDVIVLNDDRIIIRKIDGRFFVFGTPWHGDSKVCSPEEAPLEKIFFLQHARKNKVKKIDPIKAATRLIVCSFPPFWDKNGMEFTLDFCAELAQKIPCYELDFVPDKRVLDLVKSI